MFVSAAVSENNKFENSYFQITTFPRHITEPFLCELPFYALNSRSVVHHKLKVIFGISLSTRKMLGHTYIHSTTVLCDYFVVGTESCESSCES